MCGSLVTLQIVSAAPGQPAGQASGDAPAFSGRAIPPDNHGVVVLKIHGMRRIVVEIPASSGKLTPVKRASIVAGRMRRVSAHDSSWWNHLGIGRVHGEFVVAEPDAPQGVLVTADPRSARANQMSVQQYAQYMVDNIRMAMGGIRDAPIPQTSDEIHAVAVSWKQQGDVALADQNYTEAARCFEQAIKYAPHFVLPYLRAAYAYQHLGQKDRASKLLKQALALKEITPDQKREAHELISKL
jgi:Tfp pilus assembly protein PilF